MDHVRIKYKFYTVYKIFYLKKFISQIVYVIKLCINKLSRTIFYWNNLCSILEVVTKNLFNLFFKCMHYHEISLFLYCPAKFTIFCHYTLVDSFINLRTMTNYLSLLKKYNVWKQLKNTKKAKFNYKKPNSYNINILHNTLFTSYFKLVFSTLLRTLKRKIPREFSNLMLTTDRWPCYR